MNKKLIETWKKLCEKNLNEMMNPDYELTENSSYSIVNGFKPLIFNTFEPLDKEEMCNYTMKLFSTILFNHHKLIRELKTIATDLDCEMEKIESNVTKDINRPSFIVTFKISDYTSTLKLGRQFENVLNEYFQHYYFPLSVKVDLSMSKKYKDTGFFEMVCYLTNTSENALKS